jgi:hypothetical protein
MYRFSGDIEPLDGVITRHTSDLLQGFFGLISVFIVVMMSLPKFILVAIPLVIVYNEIQVFLTLSFAH